MQSMEFPRPEYSSGYPFPSPADLPKPGIEPRSPTKQADSLPAELKGSPRTLEWVDYPFSSGSSRHRNLTGVSCIAGGFFTNNYVAAAKSLQSCPTLCDPIDGSPPGSPVPGILQARTLEWVSIFFSNA